MNGLNVQFQSKEDFVWEMVALFTAFAIPLSAPVAHFAIQILS